jgi:hypothetical protein
VTVRPPACLALLLAASGCDFWQTECLREAARCAPRPVTVSPSGPLSRTASDPLSLMLDGPLRQTAPLRAQLEDDQGQVLVDLGARDAAPYTFPLSAKQRRCLPDQVSLRVYQLAASVDWAGLLPEERDHVTLATPTLRLAATRLAGVPVPASAGEQSAHLGGLWVVSNPRTSTSMIQLVWQSSDGTGAPRSRLRAYAYDAASQGLLERTATVTPATLDGGDAAADGHGGSGLLIQKAPGGLLTAFSLDSTVDATPALAATWGRASGSSTALSYQQQPGTAPLVLAVDGRRTVALISTLDGSGQPFLAARLAPFDATAPGPLPTPFAGMAASTLTSFEAVTGADALIRFLITDSASTLTALAYDPAARTFAADSALAQAVNAALAGSGVALLAALLTGDLDADGRPDLVVAGSAAAGAAVSLYVYRNVSAAGRLAFTPAAVGQTGIELGALGLSAVTRLALGDVDADGHVDVAIAGTAAGSPLPQLALVLQSCSFF